MHQLQPDVAPGTGVGVGVGCMAAPVVFERSRVKMVDNAQDTARAKTPRLLLHAIAQTAAEMAPEKPASAIMRTAGCRNTCRKGRWES